MKLDVNKNGLVIDFEQAMILQRNVKPGQAAVEYNDRIPPTTIMNGNFCAVRGNLKGRIIASYHVLKFVWGKGGKK